MPALYSRAVNCIQRFGFNKVIHTTLTGMIHWEDRCTHRVRDVGNLIILIFQKHFIPEFKSCSYRNFAICTSQNKNKFELLIPSEWKSRWIYNRTVVLTNANCNCSKQRKKLMKTYMLFAIFVYPVILLAKKLVSKCDRRIVLFLKKSITLIYKIRSTWPEGFVYIHGQSFSCQRTLDNLQE